MGASWCVVNGGIVVCFVSYVAASRSGDLLDRQHIDTSKHSRQAESWPFCGLLSIYKQNQGKYASQAGGWNVSVPEKTIQVFFTAANTPRTLNVCVTMCLSFLA